MFRAERIGEAAFFHYGEWLRTDISDNNADIFFEQVLYKEESAFIAVLSSDDTPAIFIIIHFVSVSGFMLCSLSAAPKNSGPVMSIMYSPSVFVLSAERMFTHVSLAEQFLRKVRR